MSKQGLSNLINQLSGLDILSTTVQWTHNIYKPEELSITTPGDLKQLIEPGKTFVFAITKFTPGKSINIEQSCEPYKCMEPGETKRQLSDLITVLKRELDNNTEEDLDDRFYKMDISDVTNETFKIDIDLAQIFKSMEGEKNFVLIISDCKISKHASLGRPCEKIVPDTVKKDLEVSEKEIKKVSNTMCVVKKIIQSGKSEMSDDDINSLVNNCSRPVEVIEGFGSPLRGLSDMLNITNNDASIDAILFISLMALILYFVYLMRS